MDTSLISLAGFAYGGALGACFASFLCVVAERLPSGESLGGRSHCACGRPLRAYENVPLLGWLRVRGRARCCGAPLPARYVLSELVSAVVVGWLVGVPFFEWFNGVSPASTWLVLSSTAAQVAAYLLLLTLALGRYADPAPDDTEPDEPDEAEEMDGR